MQSGAAGTRQFVCNMTATAREVSPVMADTVTDKRSSRSEDDGVGNEEPTNGRT